jgi:DNA-binding IclR family transcriptional regulator
MPWGFSKLGRLARVTGLPRPTLARQLERMCRRGLVMDVFVDGRKVSLVRISTMEVLS